MVRAAAAPLASVPTFQRPEVPSYVPALVVADTKVRPAGRRSVTCTPVAASGPLLVRVTVKVMTSPTLGVALLTALARARSARCGVSVALPLLLPLLGSNWSLWLMLAVLVSAPGLA